MNGENGRTGEPPRELMTELLLDSGIRLYVRPLSNDTVVLIERRAAELYPYPDPSPYEQDIPDSAIPGQKLNADQNPEYQALKSTIDGQRATWKLIRIRNLSAEFPDFENTDAVITHFRPRLDILIDGGIIDPPEDATALWDAIWSHCVLLTDDDRFMFNGAALNHFPITEAEIRDSFRIVQLTISRETIHGLVLAFIQRQRQASRPNRPLGAAGVQRDISGNEIAQ